jgi:hypothetical protein
MHKFFHFYLIFLYFFFFDFRITFLQAQTPSSQPSSQPSTQPVVRFSSSLKEGLVAYYPFDSNTEDKSGNNNHGTIHGSVLLTADRFNQAASAYDFNGVTGYIEIPGQQFNFPNQMSISLWVKQLPNPPSNGWNVLVDKSHYSTISNQNVGGWTLQQQSVAVGNLDFYYVVTPEGEYDHPFGTAHVTVSTTSWTHIVITKFNNVIQFYKNGVLEQTVTGSSSRIISTGNKPLLLGAANLGNSNPASGVSNYWAGAMDDVAIYNRTLDVADIYALYTAEYPTSQPSLQPSGQPTSLPTIRISSTLKNGLVAYYSFNGNANDRSSNGNNGVIHGAKNTFVTDRFGNAASACNFNGSTYIEIPGSQFNFNNNMSVAFWINPSASPDSWNVLFDKHFTSGSQHTKGWFIQQNTEPGRYAYVFIHSPGAIGATSSTNLVANTWNHVVFTKGDSLLSVYVNGQKTWSDFAASKVIIQTDPQPLIIGAVNIGQTNPASNLNYFYKGALDEVFIYNRTLSSSEVTGLYSFETPTSQPSRQPSSQPSSLPTIRISSSLKDGLTAYYSFSGNAQDRSGNKNNGILRGGMGFTTDRLGTANSAVYFDATNDFIEIPGKQFNFPNNMSVAFWIKPDASQADWAYLFDHRSTVSTVHKGGWAIVQYNNAAYNYEYVYIDTPGHLPASGRTHLAALQWAHVAFVKANTHLSVYVNGSLIWSGSPSTNSSIIPTGNNLLVIGACNVGETNPASGMANLFRGALDEIFIYGRALTQSEILKLNSFDAPTSQPSSQPSLQPSRQPSGQPTRRPSSQPSGQPTSLPTIRISSTLKNGLVAYYSFNGNANDRSSNGNNGVIHGAKNNFVTDRFGNAASACSFNGSTYIEIPGRQFNFNNNMSVAFWINPSASPDPWNALFDKHLSSVTQYEKGWFIQQNGVDASRYFYAFVHSPGQIGVTSSINNLVANSWNHVVFTKSNARLTVYVNGQETWSDVAASKVILPTDLQPLIIGAANIGQTNPASNLNYFYKGVLDEIFIYNRTLSSSEVTRLYSFETPTSHPSGQPTGQPSTQPSRQPIPRPTSQPSQQPTCQPSILLSSSSLRDGLFALYHFRGNAKDESGNRNHGTVHSGVTLTDDRFGNANNAYSFNHGYIEIPGQSFNFANNMTLSLWVKAGATQEAFAVLLSKSHYWNAQHNWVLQQANTAANTYFFNYPQTGDIAKLLISANVWSHLVITKRNKLVNIYLNGALVTSATASTAKLESNYNLPLMIGAANSGYTIPAGNIVQYYSGVIDDLFIYNRSLTVNEIRELYNYDTPTSQPSSLPSTQPSHLPSSQPSSQPTNRISSSLKNGLVAYYSFDGNAKDKSGNGNNGVLRGVVEFGADRFGQPGSACHFVNNGNGYIEVPGKQFNFHNNISVVFWLNPNTAQSTGNSLLERRFDETGQHVAGWFIRQDNTNVRDYAFTYISGPGAVTATDPIQFPAIAWTHVAFVKTGKYITIYFNGVLLWSRTVTGSAWISAPPSDLPLLIGAVNGGQTNPATGVTSYYNGFIDDIFIYNRSLTTSEVKQLYSFEVPTSQPSTRPSRQPVSLPTAQPTMEPTNRISSSLKKCLVAYYPFQGNANDESGHGYHGTIYGNNLQLVSDRFGNPNNAYLFHDNASYIGIEGTPFAFANNFSISFWVYASAYQQARSTIISKSHLAGEGWTVLWVPDDLKFEFVFYSPNAGPPGNPLSFAATILPHTWTHVVVVKERHISKVYLNGSEVAKVYNFEETVLANAMPLLIGTASAGAQDLFFTGRLDDIAFFDCPLKKADVAELYQLDTPTSQPSNSPTSQPTVRIPSFLREGLVAYYPFNGNAKDATEYNTDGVIHGGMKLVADRFGNKKAAFAFNGRDSYIEFLGYNFDRNLSISLWMKPSSQQLPWASVMDKSLYTNGYTGQFGIQQDITNTNKYLVCFGYDVNVGNCGPALQMPGDVWSHLVITKTSKVVKVYINSNLQLTFNLPGPGLLRNGNKPLIIGAANAVSAPFPTSSVREFWNGTMDDVFFFNRVLSLEEIVVLSNFDSPTSQPSGSPTTQPQSCPSSLPSNVPSAQPSGIPTSFPSSLPSTVPSSQPSSLPSMIPTIPPTSEPSSGPSVSLAASLKAGLVAYYPLDGNADDKSGNKNHGVSFFTELTHDRYGKENSAYYFNGVNSRVIINHGNSFRLLLNFTVSLWINPALNQLTTYVFLSKYAIYFAYNPSGYGFGFYDSESQFYNPGGQLQLDIGIWSHLVITKEDKFAKVFLNNKLVGSANATVASIQSNENEPVSLGSFTSPLVGFFNGSLDDIFVYDRALSTHEVFLLFNQDSPTSQPSGYPSSQPTDQPTVALDSSLKNGLVAYYPFHQNAHDNSGHEHHGVVHSAVPIADRFGQPKSAYYFNGVSSYIELPGTAFNLVNLSLLFWMNPEPNQIAFTTIFDKSCRNFQTGNVNGWIFVQTEALLNKYAFNYFNPQGIPADATNSVPVTVQARHWNHVGIVKNGNKVSFYINGELAAENANYTFPTMFSNDDLPLIVGGLNYGHTTPATFVVNYFHGSIDEVFVYNRPVSANEVKAIMEFEMPTSQPTSQPSRQLTGFPTARPTVFIPPTSRPSSRPSKSPSNQPTGRPTSQPLSHPTTGPSCSPSRVPSTHPTHQPTSRPSTQPTKQPVALPTASPSTQPSSQPSIRPTKQPTSQPSGRPSSSPSRCPTDQPSSQPSRQPFSFPSSHPSCFPTGRPTSAPSAQPSTHPTVIPSGQPTRQPWSVPSTRPSRQPSALPTNLPTKQPWSHPTSFPSVAPSHRPSFQSSNDVSVPTTSESPTAGTPPLSTTSSPSSEPTGTPTSSSSSQPSNDQTAVQQTEIPSVSPSLTPSEPVVPSSFPSSGPTDSSSGPTVMQSTDSLLPPSLVPSSSFAPTALPSNLIGSSSPSLTPIQSISVLPSVNPTRLPSSGPSPEIPSGQPTRFPSSHPSISSSPLVVPPSGKPSGQPTSRPSFQPVSTPTRKPSTSPSRVPTGQPSSQPSRQPVSIPSSLPSSKPSRQPSSQPTKQPFSRPSSTPSSQPTMIPSSSRPSSVPTIQTEKPSFPLPPSISAYPTTTRKPTRSPFTKKPTAIPSLRPSFSPTLAPTAALSIFPLSTRFQSQLFFLGSFLPNSETMTSIIQLADGSSSSSLGMSYLIFGKRNNHNDELVIGSRDSLGLYTELSATGTEGGYLTRDTVSRSFTNIGDINKDDLDDLLLCSPASSLCYLYLGKHSSGLFENLQVSSSISLFSPEEDSESYSLLGWAASPAGDMNSDGVNDFAVSALTVNTVYVLFGQSPSFPAHIILSQLTPSQGFKITGSVADVSSLSNLGIALAKVGDFNGDEISDLAITGMNVQTSQNIIFLVFGRNSTLINDLSLSLSGRSPHYHRIISPSRSFSGFSIAGLGDINGDGLGDLAIGSLPYLGGYSTQKTYVLYGRKSGFDQDFSLSNLQTGDGSEGFLISGGGFMVGSPGDVNADGLNDLMITSYTSWQAQGNAYVMIFPKNMSSSPTFAPSFNPSEQPTSTPSFTPTIAKIFSSESPTNLPSIETLQPTNRVELQTNSPNVDITRLPTRPPQPLKTDKPSRIPSFRPTSGRPTKKPSFLPTIKPSIRPSFIPSLLPSKSAPPTREPSLKPTKQRNVPFLFPSSSPSVFPTPPSSMISPVMVVIDQAGVYDLLDGHGLVTVSAGGNVLISGHNGRKVYKIIPSNGEERTSITITDFDNHQDTLDLSEFYETITTINELTYTTNPLVFHLSIEQIVVLSSHSEFDLTSKNFLFRVENPSSDSSSSSDGTLGGFSFSGSFIASIVVLVGCVCLVSVTVDLPTLGKKNELLNGKKNKNKKEKNSEEKVYPYNEEEDDEEDEEEGENEDDDVEIDEHRVVDLEAGNNNKNNDYDMNNRISVVRNTIPLIAESDENNNQSNDYNSRQQEEAENNKDEEKVSNSSDDLEMSSYSDEQEEDKPLGGIVGEGSDSEGSLSEDYELTISEESQGEIEEEQQLPEESPSSPPPDHSPVLPEETLPIPTVTHTLRANSILLNPSAEPQQEEAEGEDEENEVSDNSSSDLTLSDEEEDDDDDEQEQEQEEK